MLSTKTQLVVVASVALATFFSASPAHAQDGNSPPESTEEAELSYKEYARKGGEAFAAKNYVEAAEAFERAYELKPVPNLLYNIGRAREKLGEFERANEVYTKFVTQPDVELKARQDALQRIKTLQEVIALQKRGESVDAAAVDKEQGEHQLADAEAPAAEVVDAQDIGAQDAHAQSVPQLAEPSPVAAYVLLGAGAASLIGSGVFGYLTYAKSQAASDADTLAARRDEAASGRTYAYISDGLLVGGVILAGLGTYFWLSGSTDSADAGAGSADESPQARVTPGLSATGAALTFTLDF